MQENLENRPAARPTFSKEEAIAAATEYFKGDGLAGQVWVNKYALKDAAGNIYENTPDMMHHRIAAELARVEARYPGAMKHDEIFDLLKNFKYIIPQGSPMSGIGNNFQVVSLSNCYVIGIDGPADSYGAILKLDQEQIQLMKRRGGVGHDLSAVRPCGSPVENAAITSTGVEPFMERYSNSTREVAQGGRRGALMLSISDRHPDAERFIDAKMTPGRVTGANISVRISDQFMEAVIGKLSFNQQWPVDVPLKDATYVKEINPNTIWDKIIHNAWKSAEPGVLYWDKIIRESLPDCYAAFGYRTLSTNPCGEIPLCADDSCRLLAQNLYSYVVNPFTKDAYFDFPLFRKHATIAQRFMDDIIDLELEKIDAIIAKIKSDPEDEAVKQVELNLWLRMKSKCENGRRTGCGVTAEGDMIAAMLLTYGTPAATDFAEEVHKQFALAAFRSSVEMARDRGAFPIYDFELERGNPLLARLFEAEPQLEADMKKYGRRNIALLTIAPTGTVSLLAQTSSGIECAFMVAYIRRRKINPEEKDARVDYVDEVGDSWENNVVFHHHFKTWMQVNGHDTEKVYSQEELNALIEMSPYYKAMSNDVDWVEKVRMQGKIQKWIDHSISVTVNLPADATEELVNRVYITAWQEGCKGCTIYRDGSRGGVLIAVEAPKDTKEELKEEIIEELFKENHAPKRPKTLAADVHRFMLRGERWIGFVGLLYGKPYEVFAGPAEEFKIPVAVEEGHIMRVKKDGVSRYDFIYETKDGPEVAKNLGTAFNPQTYDTSRIISAVLRHGMPLPYVVQMIESLQLDGDLISTWKNGVKRMIKKYIPDGTVVKASAANCPNGVDGQNCHLIYQEGCLICTTCGNSKCG